MTYTVIIMRHGQAKWNKENKFIGWANSPLTEEGMEEAKAAGQMLAANGIYPDVVFSSILQRCTKTVEMILNELQTNDCPTYRSWRLVERSYGDLTGKNKADVAKEFGIEQVKAWRKSYDQPPPPMSIDHKYHPSKEDLFKNLLAEEDIEFPVSESLEATQLRAYKYWNEVILPQLKSSPTILVVSHENTLRSILMKIENVSPEDIVNLSIPRAMPLLYRLDDNFEPIGRSDNTLDATGFLRAEWLCGDDKVTEILEKERKMVYNTRDSS